MRHEHEVESRGASRPFRGPVTRTGQTRPAHGGVEIEERCGCGARRLVNENGRHREVGPWTTGRQG